MEDGLDVDEAVTRTNLFSMLACLVYAKYYGNRSSLAVMLV